jgi:hypothetical protein
MTENIKEIGCDGEWLDIQEGCECRIRGKLESRVKPGDEGLIISDESWEVLYLDFENPYSGETFNQGQSVFVKATRVEDCLVIKSNQDIEARN